MNRKEIFLAAAASLLAAHSWPARAEVGSPATEPASRVALYGDLHLHTSYSFDAYVLMGTKATPEEAYRFARGEPVVWLGRKVQRAQPLDFLAVTDHSENIGVFRQLDNEDSPLSKSDLGQRLRKDGAKAFLEVSTKFRSPTPVPGLDLRGASESAWKREIEAANASYQPGKFTTFIGYEWTSSPDHQNLHRNVIFRGDRAPYPFTSIDSKKPEDLWVFLQKLRAAGTEALAIPHNSNVSNGLMFDWVNSEGRPIDLAYAQLRAENEPLAEISQGKGSSETHPALSPSDELASFEIFDYLLATKTKSKVSGSYLREAYGRGLTLQQKLAVNPYKFGVVGGSDFHSGLSSSSEADYGGSPGDYQPDREKVKQALARPEDAETIIQFVLTGSGNLTGVWAERNTRESIYDALRRKETFATSGTRLRFRFFGGWSYGEHLLAAKDWVKTAYAGGVPMGGDLPAKPAAARAPRFLVQAVKDPSGANLDRVQVVKVWLEGGNQREKVFDVAFAGRRKPDPRTGKLPAIGNTVDLATATYQNTVGAAQLATVWQDPEFDPGAPAVYYLRVLEIPTPRWSTILAVKKGLPLSKDVPATIQERGWSSPIWYTPAKS